jgi:hypothetical protein
LLPQPRAFFIAVTSQVAVPDSPLDELYREPPDRFVGARDGLAKELRAAGEADEAARVKKLRRPTVAAWMINRAALEAAKQVEEFAAASRALEEAQARAVEGGDEGASAWREAAARERDAIAAAVDAAERLAREAGHPPSARTMELVDQTLRAASGDPELRERVVAGRLEREQAAATLGGLAAGAPPKRRPRPERKRPGRKREAGQARRELARVERALADAERREEALAARVKRAEEAVREARAGLKDAKRRRADLERQRKELRRRT